MLAAFQDLFVTLAADARAREAFGRDRESWLRDADLEPRERAALLALPFDALERYARSLLAKRGHEVMRVVPLTLRVAPKLGDLYRRWLSENPSPAVDGVLSPGASEALRALTPLRAALLRDEGQAAYAADLLAYEVLAAASRADGASRGFQSRFAVHEIARELRAGVVPIDPEATPFQYRFDRSGAKWRRA